MPLPGQSLLNASLYTDNDWACADDDAGDDREIALGTSTDKKQAKDIAAGEALRALEW